MQNHLAQANYLRLPYDLAQYKKGDHFLADLNGEKEGQLINPSFAINFGKVQKMAFVKAEADTTVDPPDSEW